MLGRPRMSDKDHLVCPYNRGIDCERQNQCFNCGWSPEVSAERRRRLAADLDALRQKPEEETVEVADE